MRLLHADREHILAHTEGIWEELRGQRIFITGGTGFFGCWILEAFRHANDELNLGAEAVVLSRAPEKFARRVPHLALHPAIRLQAGDQSTFVFPAGSFSHVIHAAVDYCEPLELFLRGVSGVKRTLDFAVQTGARRYLFTSSGAVYGRQAPELPRIPEEAASAPLPEQVQSAYGEAKRAGEFLCAAYHHQHGIGATIARGFAFVGPYLPLDQGSAIGNFIRNALSGSPITITGDGTPLRSYLYGADLAIWLWTILLRGTPARPYNVGSETEHSIAEVAEAVAGEVNPGSAVTVNGVPDGTRPPERYVPCTRRAQEELGLKARIDMREGIRRTAAWNRRS